MHLETLNNQRARKFSFPSVNETESWRRMTWDLGARRTTVDGEFLYGQHWHELAVNDCDGAGSEYLKSRAIELRH